MHDVPIVRVPLLTIMAGLFFNNRAMSDLKPEIRHVRAEHEGRLQALERQR